MSTRLPRALLWTIAVLLTLYGVHLVLRIGTNGTTGQILEDWVYNILIVLAGVVCATRGLAGDRERLGWFLMGAGITVWGLGNTYWAVLLTDQNQFPSLADWMWLTFYVLAYAGLALIFRARLPRASLNVWIDGAVAAATVSAVAAALVFDAVLRVTEGRPIAVAVNLAYPIGDTVLLALVVAAIGLSGWRLTSTWTLAAAGCVVFGVTDSMYAYQVNVGSYNELSWMNLGWPTACLLLAFAAWQPARQVRAREEGWSGIAVCVACAAIAVGVLLYDHFARVSPLTLVLASATLFGVLLRLALTFRDHLRLLETSQHEALTDSVTGLGNRRALLTHLNEQLSECAQERRLVVVLLDLNGFKEYNDSFGHLAGDALLARLGGRLGHALPNGGRAFRMGGDEFCAVVEETAESGAARIAAVAGAALSDRGEGFEIDSAWGYVTAPDEATTPTEVLKIADRRMYSSKAVRSSVGRQTARLLVRALEERDAALGEHVSQVADVAVGVGERLGLAPERLEAVRRAAELHDVGKMAIPDAILLKTGPLDDDEWVFVRRHTLTGEWILSAAPALASVAKLVRSSHERWDGAGYPDGLIGEQIPLESRIVAVCDAYAAMRSDRPYRAAMPHADALTELRANAGTQFDPVVVEAALEVLREPLRLVQAVAAA
jgi:two-component system cell cycle response regulator